MTTAQATVRPAEESARQFRDSLCRALGTVVLEAFANPDETEVYVNPSGHIYREPRSVGRVAAATRPSSEQILRFLNLVGSRVPMVLNTARPQIQAEFPAEG